MEDEKDIHERNYCNSTFEVADWGGDVDLINVDESLKKAVEGKRKDVIKEIPGYVKKFGLS